MKRWTVKSKNPITLDLKVTKRTKLMKENDDLRRALLEVQGALAENTKQLEVERKAWDVERHIWRIRMDGYLAQSAALRNFQLRTIHELL